LDCFNVTKNSPNTATVTGKVVLHCV
jgi:hypothetical protein